MRRAVAFLGFILLATLVGQLFTSSATQAREVRLAAIAFTALPAEAQETLRLIQQGGPFPYPRKDGSIFGNFEQRLPPRPRGYYREYTVRTPGSRDRGARRIIAGRGQKGDVATAGEYYYTDNHYRSFRWIREAP